MPHILLLLLFVLPACLVAAYYAGLALARLCGMAASCQPSEVCQHSFVVLIPAHNEEATIRHSIDSCLQLDYPRDKFTVVVIADNCTDATAALARQLGVVCLERTDLEWHGKGHALRWAFEQLADGSHDALLVVDSDCTVDLQALRVLDTCLAEGSRVLQMNHVVANPDAGALCYAARVGQFLEYDFGYAPKSQLGLWVPLMGTGMAFHRDVLEQYPWASRSVSEDIEYSLLLVQHDINARFVSNVAVRHAAEAGMRHLAVQRRRWARGTLRFGKRRALGLVLSGLLRRSLLVSDSGWTLLTISKPLILIHLAMTLGLSAALVVQFHDPWAWSLAGLAAAAAATQAGYYAIGILSLGLTGSRLRLLARFPVVTLQLAWIAVRSLFDFREPTWDRTPRTDECRSSQEKMEAAR